MPSMLPPQKGIYVGDNAGRGYSGGIWHDIPGDISDPNVGHFFADDFTNAPTFATTVSQDGYYTAQDSGVTIGGLSTAPEGILVFNSVSAADNDEGYLITGGNLAPIAVLTSLSKRKVWWEARFAITNATIADQALFIGLCTPGAAVAGTLAADAGTLIATKAFVGFTIPTASPTVLQAVYQKASTAQQVAAASANTMVSGTYVKVGIRFDGLHLTKPLKFYVNGVEVGSASPADVAAATFPTGVNLAMCMGFLAGEAVAKKVNLDWWAVGQLAA